nr:bifunctional diaminohydroxyphosphoribosylaminopyrimidine deaminase/5-amino-6-(5-phosphoribosylamino)uracil reductase RibD [uncultured Undibacterium sp.]
MTQSKDLHYMHLALELASRVTILTSPNPKVGCVIVKDGHVLGQGWTQAVGQAHAEVMALRDAASFGHDVRGATAYVTLEPCSHYGRTPPCANALIEAGLARVVAALEDANPQVAGRGFYMLQEAGIAVTHGLLAKEARAMNLGFFKRMEVGKPWVRLKMAASLDGYTALPNGQSQWVTGNEARLDGHRWRARSDAILTGIGTVLADDPQMNVRLPEQEVLRQPRKFVLDSQLRTPVSAKLFHGASVSIVHAKRNPDIEENLQQAGANLLYLPSENSSGTQVDLLALMSVMGEQQINELHVEAGAKLSGALIAANCVDELLLYLAPKLLGSGAGMFALPELQQLNQARELNLHEVLQLSDNTIRVIARFA